MDYKQHPVMQVFTWLSQFPRATYHEELVQSKLKERCQNNGWNVVQDGIGNLVVYIPGTQGMEKNTTCILQAHVDMVCEKTPESQHDFSRDGIELVYDGDWLHANQTTLGADNGIGVSLALAFAESGQPHPPLELLFTVDEECTMTGAANVEPQLLQGKYLLNLDGDFRAFVTGCAGGRKATLKLPHARKAMSGTRFFELKVSGLAGGHSGENIHLERGNSNILMARIWQALTEEIDLELIGVQGGTAMNAIPRDTVAQVALTEKNYDVFTQIVTKHKDIFKAEHGVSDPMLNVSYTEIQKTDLTNITVLDETSFLLYIRCILAIDNGVFSRAIESGATQTSSNLANLIVNEETVEIRVSQRSAIESHLILLNKKIEGLALALGISCQFTEGYPCWTPVRESTLVTLAQGVYRETFNKEQTVRVIHGGVECGFLLQKLPHIQALSFGPTTENLHSPEERLNLPSLGDCWQFLLAFMSKIS